MSIVLGNVHNRSLDGWQHPHFLSDRARRISWERWRLAGEWIHPLPGNWPAGRRRSQETHGKLPNMPDRAGQPARRFYHCFSNTRISFLINAMMRCLAR
jgi:hypothetical protein